MEKLEQGSGDIPALSLRVADGHELVSQLDGWRCLSLEMSKLLKMLRGFAHTVRQRRHIWCPLFQGTPALQRMGYPRCWEGRSVACSLGGYCF